jgi:hypothetical protein
MTEIVYGTLDTVNWGPIFQVHLYEITYFFLFIQMNGSFNI